MADLFCGAGGTSTGAIQAAQKAGYRLRLMAVNHWSVAVATHTANHPDARHECVSLASLNPHTVDHDVDLLSASPECTHHSRARGGKPKSDQSRASAWHVVQWAEAKRPLVIQVENVPEFLEWGPLDDDGLPAVGLKGTLFQSWVNALQSLGYTVEYQILNAMHYGDATSRRRLIVIAYRDVKFEWPSPTHASKPRPARDVIDWNLKGQWLHERKRPLKPKTMERITKGIQKFAGRPFVIGQQSGAAPRSTDQPLPTVAGAGAISLCEPFLINMRGTTESHINSSAKSIDEPVPGITAEGNHVALCEPFLIHVTHGGTRRPHSIEEPIPTITGANRGELALVEPFLLKYYGTGVPISVNNPMPTITANDRFALVEPTHVGVRFRMLQPHELSAAMGFPKNYHFTGTRKEQVKQIGNAVPVGLAEAIYTAIFKAL